MTQPIRMRRLIAVTLVLVTFLFLAQFADAVTPTLLGSDHVIVLSRTEPPRHRVCPIHWRRGRRYVRRLIVCAANHWRVPGGATMALSVAWNESRFRADAYNLSGAEGVYQHMRQYWPGRASTYGFPGVSAFNARANIIVTMKMVRRLGNWSPWGR
jgi:soluble lytic murein transglycosylase-like protein